MLRLAQPQKNSHHTTTCSTYPELFKLRETESSTEVRETGGGAGELLVQSFSSAR